MLIRGWKLGHDGVFDLLVIMLLSLTRFAFRLFREFCQTYSVFFYSVCDLRDLWVLCRCFHTVPWVSRCCWRFVFWYCGLSRFLSLWSWCPAGSMFCIFLRLAHVCMSLHFSSHQLPQQLHNMQRQTLLNKFYLTELVKHGRTRDACAEGFWKMQWATFWPKRVFVVSILAHLTNLKTRWTQTIMVTRV